MSGLRSALVEAATSIVRQPVRTLLCALGTVVAVGAFTTTNGLTESASNAVSASFNELRATTVEFQGPSTLSETDVARLATAARRHPCRAGVGSRSAAAATGCGRPVGERAVADAAVGHGDVAVGAGGDRGGAVVGAVL